MTLIEQRKQQLRDEYGIEIQDTELKKQYKTYTPTFVVNQMLVICKGK